MTNRFIAPGAILGIIGGGVVANRLATVAKQMGLHTVILAESEQDPALAVADVPLIGSAQDPAALSRVAEVATVLTYVDENVDGAALADLTTARQLPSGVDILAVTQDRYLEKVFLEDLNMNILPYAQVVSANDINKAIESVGFPAILKPIQKGVGADSQLLLRQPDDVARAQQQLPQRPYVMEAWLDHPAEFSVMVAKLGDQVRVMPVIQTEFEKHRLKAAFVPASGGPAVAKEIQRVAGVIAEHLDYNGVFGVELFMTQNQSLYVKRLFPGPRMAGNILALTAGVSTYEMHLRALLGWPLPRLRLARSGVVMPLYEEDLEPALTQLQIKPDWQFAFYPKSAEAMGEMAIFGEYKTVAAAVNATDHFHLD